jgi:hypothetical protein
MIVRQDETRQRVSVDLEEVKGHTDLMNLRIWISNWISVQVLDISFLKAKMPISL